MSPQSLSEAELERVREILDRFGDKRAMNMEQIDGFLAALVCGPEDIPQSEYLPEIWGDDMVNEAAFARQPLLQVFVSLIMRHRDAIAHTLRTDAVYTPLLLQDQDGVACGNIGAAAAVMRIYRYFQERRFVATYATGNSTTYQRVTPKVGRNEPCPCGSGKKYKQCCGRITLH